VIGKTNCDEFAMGSSTENSAYGPVRNRSRWSAFREAPAAARRRWWHKGTAVVALGSDTGDRFAESGSF